MACALPYVRSTRKYVPPRTLGFGITTRADLERLFGSFWLARYTASATWSQKSQGLAGWSAVDLMRGFASRRAIAIEAEVDAQTEAAVPLHNFGCKIAYRQSVLRKWLILELRTSFFWPKDSPDQQRPASFGVGAGFEMLLGTDEFLARPVTF